MKIVLDADAIVAALRSPSGASAELLRRARQEQITLAASVSLFLEYEAVCTRAEHLVASGLSARQLHWKPFGPMDYPRLIGGPDEKIYS